MKSAPTSDPVRIAITYPFALGTHSGGSLALFEIARGLARRGLEVVVLPVSTAGWTRWPRRRAPRELSGDERQRELEEAGVEVVRVDPHPLSQWLDGRSIERAMERLLERRRIDLLLGFHNETSRLPALARRRSLDFGMIALWQSYRMTLVDRLAGLGWSRPWVRWANRKGLVEPLRSARTIFATSEFTRRELAEVVGVDPRRVHVCYLGVDEIFGGVEREPCSEVRRLVFFGRLVPAKGHLDALEALAAVARRGRRDWTYRLMGSGDAAAARQRAEELGIGDRIEIRPFQGREALVRELARADLAVMPSYSESFGLSIAEAQAAGLAVVAYDAGSVPEIVVDGVTGWLAPVGDVDRLGELVERALGDPEAVAAAGRAGRQRVISRFTWDRTCDRILAGLAPMICSGEAAGAP